MTDHCVLLTGSSGLVGSAWLPLLLRNGPSRRIVVLRRSQAVPFWNDLVTALDGDLTRSKLGIAAGVRKFLIESVTEIIHCAADIRFRLPIDQPPRLVDMDEFESYARRQARKGPAIVMEPLRIIGQYYPKVVEVCLRGGAA